MLFLSDLDGTLIDAHCTISKEDVLAIQQWTKKHSFGVVTGRDEAFCEALMGKYHLQCDCLIANNGGSAYFKKECVYSSLMDIEDSIRMCKIILSLQEVDLFYTDEKGNRYYPMQEYGQERFRNFQKKQPSITSFHSMDILEYLKTRKKGLAKLSMYVEKDLPELLKKYRSLFPNYEVMATSKDYIEITKKNTNKWEAFKHLSIEQAAFIGDGENDICMLENLKDTYVMSHAPKRVRELGICVNSVAQAIEIESEKNNV